jgi:hypothetical protein
VPPIAYGTIERLTPEALQAAIEEVQGEILHQSDREGALELPAYLGALVAERERRK